LVSHRVAGHLLADPAVIRNKEGRGARVFTPFWRRLRALGVPAKPLPPPETLCPGPDLQGATVEDWRLEPLRPDWAGGLRDTWTPGELAGQRRLEAFLATGIEGYSGGRDRLDRDSTSRLSPYLRFGEVSPRQVWHAARFAAAEHPALSADIDKFLSELGWLEFCQHLLFDAPDLAIRNLRPSFDASRGGTTMKRSRHGTAVKPAIPLSMPACANCGTQESCTTAYGWWSPPSWSSIS
jgi:deoxyribodipyrimidine photo-lyase